MLRSFFCSSRRRHTRFSRDWSSDVCSSDLPSGSADRLMISMTLPHSRGNAVKDIGPCRRVHRRTTAFTCRAGCKELDRSEERRVGKECTSWWLPEQSKQKG